MRTAVDFHLPVRVAPFGVAMACRGPRRSSRGGRGRRAAGRWRRSGGQSLRTVRLQRRPRRNLRARRGVRNRDAMRRRQGRTPGPRGGVGRERPWGRVGRWRRYGARRIGGGAGRFVYESLRVVASAQPRRYVEHTREHENRERRCRHDGCAHDARSYDIGLVRLASVVVPRRAALRPRAPEAGGVPRRAVLQPASAGFRERLDSC